MGREISLFSDYRQQENSLTNHCGVMLRLIYRESPEQFEDLIAEFLPEAAQFRVGPMFTQQEKSARTVPDLLIRQDAFSLFFETKIDDWFHHGQIEGHIDALANAPGVKVLFCLSNFQDGNSEKKFSELADAAKKRSILISFLSFEALITKIRALRLSNTLAETAEEFEDYLDRNGLLSQWKSLLDVVNCGFTMDEIAAGAYMCPNKGGPYRHNRARFLGTYKNKAVRSIHEIDALVTCAPEAKEFEVHWSNIEQSEAELIERAKLMANKINVEAHAETLKNDGLQIFLLGHGAETEFLKNSPGGMQSSHLTFQKVAKSLGATNAQELAERLNGRKWSEFGR
jgi:hypothetical protein